MSKHQPRACRRRPVRRPLASPMAIGGALLLLAIAGLLLASILMSRVQRLTLETHNVQGLATAPVEVDEWSDFQ